MNNSGNGAAISGVWGKRHTIRLEDIQLEAAKGISQTCAGQNLGVSLSTMKRRCRELGIKSWPSANHSTNTRLPAVNEDAPFIDDGVFHQPEMQIDNFAAASPSFLLNDFGGVEPSINEDLRFIDDGGFHHSEMGINHFAAASPSFLLEDDFPLEDTLLNYFGGVEPSIDLLGISNPNIAPNSMAPTTQSHRDVYTA